MSLIRRHPLSWFVGLAYAIVWALQLVAITLAQRAAMTLSNEANYLSILDLLTGRLRGAGALALVLSMLGAGPLIASLLVTVALYGTAGVRELWQRCTLWRVGGWWYLVVLMLPLLLSAASLMLGLLSTGGPIRWAPMVPLVHAVPFVIYLIIFTGVAEEPGWRGFALPWLQRSHTAYRASWILGFIWGLWHLPFTIYANRSLEGVTLVITLIVSILLLTIGIVGWTIVLTWIYNSTRSVLLLILLHGWSNAVQSYLVLSSDNMVAKTVYGVLPWGLAFMLLRIYGRENLARQPRHRAPDPVAVSTLAPTNSMV